MDCFLDEITSLPSGDPVHSSFTCNPDYPADPASDSECDDDGIVHIGETVEMYCQKDLFLETATDKQAGPFTVECVATVSIFLITDKGSFTLHNKTLRCWTHGNLVTFNNGLGPLKTKSGGGLQGGGKVGGMCWTGILR